jgi:hypothetical protein
LSKHSFGVKTGLMSREAFAQSRRLAATLHDEILRSFTSSRRMPRGELSFVDSDAFHRLVADALRGRSTAGYLDEALAGATALDDETRGKLNAALGDVTVADVLDADSSELERLLRTDRSGAIAVKRALLGAIAARDRGDA